MIKNKRADTDNYEIIFSNDTPLFDLRAPVEFNQGAFSNATNLPLMTDEERKKVGICYKHQGQETAIKLGHKLVSGAIREQRMEQWIHFVQQNENGYLYCFRGGLRSQTVRQWLATEGIHYPLVQGGYKAMRRFLLNQFDQLTDNFNFTVIGGRTGTRKTDLILTFPNAIDLEGRANHRGSSFGRRVGGQPTVINFENNVAIDLVKLKGIYSNILVEDEGVTIGRCSVPEPLRNQIKTAPLYLVEASIEERIETILNNYVLGLSKEYQEKDPVQGWCTYKDAMLSSLGRIKKRLGGERYSRLYQLMAKAFDKQENEQNQYFHYDWISVLLREYYDPMYDFQITGKQHRVQQRGSWQDIENELSSKKS